MVISSRRHTVFNMHAANIAAPKYTKQLLRDFQGEIDSRTMIIGEFNTPLTSMDRLCRQKFNKDTVALNETLDQIDLVYLHRIFHLNAAKYTLFSSAHSPGEIASQAAK